MEPLILLLLFCAGLAGGIVNAIAGGATLITFPAMLAAGLPPLVANASNAVAITPGHLIAALADRDKLPPFDVRFAVSLSAGLAGGALGAWLLFATSERLFTLMVPALVGLATLVFAFGRHLKAMLPNVMTNAARASILTATSVYGGYFGAGLGIMLLAALSITGREDSRRANALKNMLASAVSAITVLVFTSTGLIHWPATLIVLAGAFCGGFIGGRLVARLPASYVRKTVIVIGIIMTAIYAGRYWF